MSETNNGTSEVSMWRKRTDRKLTALKQSYKNMQDEVTKLKEQVLLHQKDIKTNTEVCLRIEKKLDSLVITTSPVVTAVEKLSGASRITSIITIWLFKFLDIFAKLGLGILVMTVLIYAWHQSSSLVDLWEHFVQTFNGTLSAHTGTPPISVD